MFKKTYVEPFTKNAAVVSSDSLYWKNFTSPIFLKEVHSIDYIDVSPIEPHFFAVTCSSRVQLYHPITRMIHKNYNRFKEAAYGGVFRSDGRLLLVGSNEGSAKLFDVSSKSLLRVFKGHESAVHRVAFLSDNQIVSFSDDKSIIQWDLPSEKQIHTYLNHSDYIRSGVTSDSYPNFIVSGSYDHTVRIWDKREHREIINVDHGSPVESVLLSQNGSLLISAGGTDIKIWNVLAGGRLMSRVSQHHKTITCLRFATGGKRLLSASLDRQVNIYDMTSFEVIHSLSYSSPILSLAVSPKDNTLISGMSDGILAISRKEEDTEEEKIQKEKDRVEVRRHGHKAFLDYQQTEFGVVEVNKKDARHDYLLRKFRYSQALDSVLTGYYHNSSPGVTVAVCQELIRRDGLKQALAGREGESLIKVLRFLTRHMRKPRFVRILLEVAHILTDLYQNKVEEDPLVNKAWLELFEDVKREVYYLDELMEIQGALETMNARCEPPKRLEKQINYDEEALEPSELAMDSTVVHLQK